MRQLTTDVCDALQAREATSERWRNEKCQYEHCHNKINTSHVVPQYLGGKDGPYDQHKDDD
jgi:hypothetical protein